MKAFLLLCFALIACHQVTATLTKAEILAMLKAEYVIDDVLDLFKALQSHEQQELEQTNQEYSQTSPQLQGQVSAASTLLQNHQNQCARINDDVQQAQNQAADLQKHIKESEDTIAQNEQNAKSAADARCASNLLFISELGDRQDAVNFLTFLRAKVADPSFLDYLSQQHGAFVQLKTVFATKQENEILSFIAKHHMLSMMQIKQDYEGEADLEGQLSAKVRTSDEVGTDHVDNTRGALTVQGITNEEISPAQYVSQLLGYIDQLIANLQSDVEKLQNVETTAVQAFIDYKRKLKEQNIVLQKVIDQLNARLKETQENIAQNQAAAQQCQDGLPAIEQELQEAQDALAAYQDRYNKKVASLQETIALLGQVIETYSNEVVNVASDAQKDRADDYIDNQVFDRTENFTPRTAVPEPVAAQGS